MKEKFYGINEVHTLMEGSRDLEYTDGEERKFVYVGVTAQPMHAQRPQELVLIFDVEDIIEIFNYVLSKNHAEILDSMFEEISHLDLEV